MRTYLEKQKRPYVLGVGAHLYVRVSDSKSLRVKKLAAGIAAGDWQRITVGEGSKGPRIYDWAWVKLPAEDAPKGWVRWLLARRSVDRQGRGDRPDDVEKPQELKYYLAAGPWNTSLATSTEVAGKRWAIEESFEEAKGEAGLDEYEVRKWEGWYRHITLSLLAHAYLMVCRAYDHEKGEMVS